MTRLRLPCGLAALALALLVSPTAVAEPSDSQNQASFSCTLKTLTAVEHAICDDDKLQELDGRLNAVFRARRKQLDDQAFAVLLNEERHWLVNRNSSCYIPSDWKSLDEYGWQSVKDCLYDIYNDRVQTLENADRGRFDPYPYKVAPTDLTKIPVFDTVTPPGSALLTSPTFIQRSLILNPSPLTSEYQIRKTRPRRW